MRRISKQIELTPKKFVAITVVKTVVQAKEPPPADEAESLEPPSDLAGLRC